MEILKVAKTRQFFAIMKSTFFASLLCFVSLNAFANCQNLSAGYACVQDSPVICSSGCYCLGGNNVSSSEADAILTGSCGAAPGGTELSGGAVRCPSNAPYSPSGAKTDIECYDTYSGGHTPQFYIETTQDTTEFYFMIQARGDFYIDCDVNNVGGLSSNQRFKKYTTVGRSDGDNDQMLVMCGYASAGKNYKIGISSENVTRYPFWDCSDDDACFSDRVYSVDYNHGYQPDHSVIRFMKKELDWAGKYAYITDTKHIYRISGSLGKVFPTLGTSHLSQQPAFENIFYQATNLTGTLPSNLFSGDCVYNSTTKKCSSGKGIYGHPSNRMYSGAFTECAGLTDTIPDYFFGYLYGYLDNGADDSRGMTFAGTFKNCTGLYGELSDTWFKNLEISDINGVYDETFRNTRVSGNIPDNFFGTFVNGILNCATDGAEDSFGDTFEDTQISGKIPYNLFKGINGFLENNDYGIEESPTIGDWCADPVRGAMNEYETFKNTNMATSCAADEYQYVSGLEIMFGNRGIICKKCPTGTYGTGGKNITSCLSENSNYFTIKTVDNMPQNTEFKFMISALGAYIVDWGDGTSDGLSTNASDIDNDNDFYFSHTYTTSGSHTIKVYGNTIAYSNDYEQPAISFYDGTAYEYIKEIRGSIGSVFPTVTLPANLDSDEFETHPQFYQMCKECTNLTTIDSNMFSGVTGSVDSMFEEAFYGCTELTSIPSGLFSGITGHAPDLFYSTFYDCDALKSVPDGLFSGINGADSSMFYETFYSCEDIKTIPANLFSGVSGAAPYMFEETFYGCSSLESIPEGLFSNISGAANSMFSDTFEDCDALESIPSTLFDGVDETASDLFYQTFYDCDGLKSIPADLFKNVSGTPQPKMFYQTFALSPNIKNFTFSNGDEPVSYIPSTFFGALENSNYTTSSSQDDWVAKEMFNGDDYVLDTCPANTTEFDSKFKTEYAPKKSCVPVVIDYYTISYNLNGGTVSGTNPTTVQIDPGTTGQIINPTRTGWTFAGWNISGMDTSTHSYWRNSAWYEFSSETLTRNAYQWYKNLRSTPGTVTFSAVWKKNCPYRTYYNKATQTCDACPRGFYCGGGYFYTDTPDIIIGKETCPTGFTSETSAGSITDCYKTGTTTCAVANPVAVAENATSVIYANTGSVPCKIYPEEDYEDTQAVSACVPDDPDACAVTGMNCNSGYVSTQIASALASKNVPNYWNSVDYISVDFSGNIGCENKDCLRTNKSNGMYDIWLNDEYGIVRGRALCSSTAGTSGEIGTPSLSNGKYCWCKTTLFKENDNSAWTPAVSSWAKMRDSGCNGTNYDTYEECVANCSYDCADYVFSQSTEEATCSSAEERMRSTLFNDAKTYVCAQNVFTVSYNINYDGGTNPASATYTAGGNAITLPTPTRTGYDFLGWYSDSSMSSKVGDAGASYTPAQSITLYAQWTPKVYNITYRDGNVMIRGITPATYTYGVGATINAVPRTAHGRFAGWCTSAGLTGCSEIKTISTTETENKTYWAKFICDNGYTYNLGDANVPYLLTLLNDNDKTGSGYVSIDGQQERNSGVYGLSTTNDRGKFVIDYGNKGKITGHGRCSTQAGTVVDDVWPTTSVLPDASGQYCYCKLDTYKPLNGASQDLHGFYVLFSNSYDTTSSCESSCSGFCEYSFGSTVSSVIDRRDELLDSVGASYCKPNTYTITYNINYVGGTNPASVTYAVGGDAITLPVPNRTGYNFNGWYTAPDGGTKVNSPYTTTENITLYAHWTSNAFTVSYNINYVGGTNPASATYTTGGDAITLPEPTRTGYTFGGWYTAPDGGTKVNSPYTTTENITLYAHWTSNAFTVSYNINYVGGTNPASATYTTGGDAITLPEPTRTGYAFGGWYTSPTGGNKVNSPYTTTENITLYAKWTPADYQIKYNNVNNQSITPSVYTYSTDDQTITPSEPTKTGYKFVGWCVDEDECDDPQKTIGIPAETTDTINVYAQWKRQITIHFSPNAEAYETDNIPEDIVCIEDESCFVKYVVRKGLQPLDTRPTRYGHIFYEWNTDQDGMDESFQYVYSQTVYSTQEYVADLSELFDLGYGYEITLYAQWSEQDYDIKYYDGADLLEEDISPSGYTYSEEEQTITPDEPTKHGYTFVGWCVDEGTCRRPQKTIDIPEYKIGTLSLYAQWTAISYNIGYELNGGSATNQTTYTVEMTSFTLHNPTKTGYNFVGWCETPNCTDYVFNYTFDTSVGGDRTMYAIYEPIQYTITFDAHGGSGYKVPVVCSYDSNCDVSNTEISRAGYDFIGWTQNINMVQYPQTPTGISVFNLTNVPATLVLYAMWNANGIPLKYVYNNGTNATNDSCVYDARFTPPVPTRTGYVFAGWNVSAEQQ